MNSQFPPGPSEASNDTGLSDAQQMPEETITQTTTGVDPTTEDAIDTPAGAPARRGWGEWAIAAALFGMGFVVLFDGLNQKASTSASGIGAGFLPSVIGPLIMVLAVLLFVQLFRGKYGEAEQAEGDVDVSKTKWIPLLVTVAALFFFVFAVEPLGYMITAAVVFWVIAWAMGSRKYLNSAIIAVVLSVTIYFAFTRLLSIYLPAGVFEGVL